MDDKLEGEGAIYLANGRYEWLFCAFTCLMRPLPFCSEFHGFFVNGRIEGKGTYTYADGSRFTGEFRYMILCGCFRDCRDLHMFL